MSGLKETQERFIITVKDDEFLPVAYMKYNCKDPHIPKAESERQGVLSISIAVSDDLQQAISGLLSKYGSYTLGKLQY